jgi:hypothetical protein
LIQRVSPSATGRSSRSTIPGRRNSASPASRTQPPEVLSLSRSWQVGGSGGNWFSSHCRSSASS